MTELTLEHISGARLYGDDFTPDQIDSWLQAEELGYFGLASETGNYEYGYHTVNNLYGYSRLGERNFARCLALGCARGDDILPIADRIGEIVAIEPAKPWWSDRIGSTPARYMMPNKDGSLDLPDASVDLVTCFGVLHHVPNVTTAFREIARVCATGAIFLLREPSHSMGDFRQPRSGLTKNERGLDPGWVVRRANESGFVVERVVLFDVGLLSRILLGFGIDKNKSLPLLTLDRWLARLTAWNGRYWRTRPWHKLAPSSAFYVLRRA